MKAPGQACSVMRESVSNATRANTVVASDAIEAAVCIDGNGNGPRGL